MLWVHKIAETTTITLAIIVLAAFSFSKICYWRILAHDSPARVIAAIEPLHSCLCLFLCHELSVNITDHVISNIVRDCHLFNLTKLSKFHKHFLIEVFEMIYCIYKSLLWYILAIGKCNSCWRVLIQVRENHCLRQWWLIVMPCARVSVSASANFEIKRTIDFVFFCTENFG